MFMSLNTREIKLSINLNLEKRIHCSVSPPELHFPEKRPEVGGGCYLKYSRNLSTVSLLVFEKHFSYNVTACVYTFKFDTLP